MKILQVSPYFHPYIGGQERYVHNLGKALVNRGHSVEIFTSNFPKGKRLEIIDGMKVRRFNFFCRPLNNPFAPVLFFDLIKYCRDFDVIHTHNEHTVLSLYCTLMRSYTNVPLVLTCHGQLRFNHFAKDFIEHAYSKTIATKVLGKADKIITISDSDKSYIQSLGVPLNKIVVIPNGVDLTNYKHRIISSANDTLFEGKRVVLFVGPILKRKGPQILIRAIPEIVKELSDVIFVFAGGGNFREEAENLCRALNVEKFTHFTGYVPQEQLYDLYRRSDLFVLPSYSEALSYTILDAFVFSKPVISTLIPCIKDYLSETAVLVKPGDPKALAEAVILLLTDNRLAKELGAKGRKLVETRFSWNIVVDEMVKTYKDVIQ